MELIIQVLQVHLHTKPMRVNHNNQIKMDNIQKHTHQIKVTFSKTNKWVNIKIVHNPYQIKQ